MTETPDDICDICKVFLDNDMTITANQHMNNCNECITAIIGPEEKGCREFERLVAHVEEFAHSGYDLSHHIYSCDYCSKCYNIKDS